MTTWEIAAAGFLTGVISGLGFAVPFCCACFLMDWLDRRRERRERLNPPTPKGWGHL